MKALINDRLNELKSKLSEEQHPKLTKKLNTHKIFELLARISELERLKKLIPILLIILASCSPSKRINRIVKKHPELLVSDTIRVVDTVIIDSYIHDTTTKFIEHKTVEVINNERVNLKYRYDTITNEIHHYVECKGDTLIREVLVPYKQIKTVKKHSFNWFLIGLLIGFISIVLINKLTK